jgi:hypothetical protein
VPGPCRSELLFNIVYRESMPNYRCRRVVVVKLPKDRSASRIYATRHRDPLRGVEAEGRGLGGLWEVVWVPTICFALTGPKLFLNRLRALRGAGAGGGGGGKVVWMPTIVFACGAP